MSQYPPPAYPNVQMQYVPAYQVPVYTPEYTPYYPEHESYSPSRPQNPFLNRRESKIPD
jgi:hypothetical protein